MYVGEKFYLARVPCVLVIALSARLINTRFCNSNYFDLFPYAAPSSCTFPVSAAVFMIKCSPVSTFVCISAQAMCLCVSKLYFENIAKFKNPKN